jgi:PAS domain S-box-containing protein
MSNLKIEEIICSDVNCMALVYRGKQFLLEDSIQIPLNNLAFQAHEPTFYNSQFIPVIDPSSYLMGIVQSTDLRKAITQNLEFISVFSSTKALAVPPTITFDELMQLIENDSSYYQSNILVVDTQSKLLGYIPPHLINMLSSFRFSSLFFHAVDNIKEGLIIIDKDSHAVYVNSRYSEILGVPTYKVLGRRLAEIEPQSLILKTLATGESYSNQPVKIQSLNKDVVVNISPVRAGNEIIGAVSVFQDITEIAQLHNKLNQYQKLAMQLYVNIAHNTFHALSPAFQTLVGSHSDFIRCLHLANLVATTDASVLLTGESGTGKELLAHAVHQASSRCSGPFIEVNCASVPESLVESELFGYEEGAFTGAKKGGKPGKFLLAHGGTLFLDEIGDMSQAMQSKLLRVLQLGTVEPVGALSPRRVDVRIISATNKDLLQLVNNGAFRLDLFYRINVFHIQLPPLRDRGEDVVLLAQYLLENIGAKYHFKLVFAPETIEAIKSYNWPGNTRELENAIHFSVIMTGESGTVLPSHLPNQVLQAIEKITGKKSFIETSINPQIDLSLPFQREDIERQEILQALRASRTCTEVIERLNISRRTFYRKLKKYKISPRAELKKVKVKP